MRAVIGATYMLAPDEELWQKELPAEVEALLEKQALGQSYVPAGGGAAGAATTGRAAAAAGAAGAAAAGAAPVSARSTRIAYVAAPARCAASQPRCSHGIAHGLSRR